MLDGSSPQMRPEVLETFMPQVKAAGRRIIPRGRVTDGEHAEPPMGKPKRRRGTLEATAQFPPPA